MVLAGHALGERPDPVFDDALTRIRSGLREGGIVVLAVPAAIRQAVDRPFLVRAAPHDDDGGGAAPHGFSEMELQYRMTRAAFQAVRLRRLPASAGVGDILVAVAVRRAFN